MNAEIIERIGFEIRELQIKIDKLKIFLKDKNYHQNPLEFKQLILMEAYLEILNKRIAFLKPQIKGGIL